jgi:hypothetical protein
LEICTVSIIKKTYEYTKWISGELTRCEGARQAPEAPAETEPAFDYKPLNQLVDCIRLLAINPSDNQQPGLAMLDFPKSRNMKLSPTSGVWSSPPKGFGLMSDPSTFEKIFTAQYFTYKEL